MCLLPCWLVVSFEVCRNFCGYVRGWKKSNQKGRRGKKKVTDSFSWGWLLEVNYKRDNVCCLCESKWREWVVSVSRSVRECVDSTSHKVREWELGRREYISAILVMQSAPKSRDKIKVADVVVSTNHVTFLTKRFPRLISLPTSTIFVSGTSGITAILKYRGVNLIYVFLLLVISYHGIKIKF